MYSRTYVEVLHQITDVIQKTLFRLLFEKEVIINKLIYRFTGSLVMVCSICSFYIHTFPIATIVNGYIHMYVVFLPLKKALRIKLYSYIYIYVHTRYQVSSTQITPSL
jgi:hypothetical protein